MSQQKALQQEEEENDTGGYVQRYGREPSLIEREVEVDTSMNYVSTIPSENLPLRAEAFP